MKWAKLHGLGNDFLIARAEEARRTGLQPGALAARVCRRHTGLGADGVLYYEAAAGDPEAGVSARIFNADGSEAEMSGNGTRCLAAYLARTAGLPEGDIRIRTAAGVRVFRLVTRNGPVFTFAASMGRPVTDPALVPAALGDGSAPVVDFPLPLGSDTVLVTVTSMGNPHCSTFWNDIEAAPVRALGPLLENHEAFPNRSNVEFIQILDRHRLRVRFWERGVGPTLASGTGGAAAAVAAILGGKAESPVVVEVEMGRLLVQWQAPGDLILTGPAEFIGLCEYSVEAAQ